MKLLSVRKLINTAVFGIVAIQLVAMIDVQHQLQILNRVSPLLPLMSALGLIILWVCVRKFSKNERVIHAKNLQLKQESLALNVHALVLLTDSNGVMTHVNDNFLEKTGYTLEEVVGKQVDMLYFPDDIDMCQDLKSTVYGGGTWQGETRIRCKDGSELWTRLTILPGYDRQGKPCGAISVRTDITEVKQMRIGQEVFRALNSLVDEVFIFDFETMQLKYANSAAATAHGLTRPKSFNADMTTIHPIYASDTFLGAIDELRESSGHLVTRDVEKDGKYYELRLQLLSLKDGSKDVLASFHDISERIEADQLRGEFISTVSHELRSPMTSIKGAMGLLLAGSTGELPDRARDILEIAHRNSDRLINIINDLLDIEKIAAGKMSFDCGPYDISALLDEAVLANENFSKRFDVTIERDEALQGQVLIDFDRSLQVLNNLLSNASKFSPPGGKVILGGRDTGDSIEITVQDFGKGIPDAMVNKVFDKFAQINPRSDSLVRGTGLGLAIVKAIVEEQGGVVSVKSTEGKGSTFAVTFPKVKEIGLDPYIEEWEDAS